MRRLPTSDWKSVGWHYKAIHAGVTPWHNPLWLRTKGAENLAQDAGFLLAANHTSWWDPILLSASLGRPVHWMAKQELMRGAFGKWFFQGGGCIPVDRDKRNPHAMDAAIQALRDGQIIGIFPEGTRYVGELGPAKTGVARLALQAGVPIVPAGVLTDRFWPRGRAVPKMNERVYVNFGAPMRFEGDPSDPKVARDVTDQVMVRVKALLDECREARERKDKWDVP